MCSRQKKGDALDEEVSVYGISDDSRYVKIADLEKLKENEIYISASFAEKYDLLIGDVISLDEKYENKQVYKAECPKYDRNNKAHLSTRAEPVSDRRDL